ncbi:MAG: TIGR02594 family protein [Labrys sp. (in: a-proteobacteria)]
MRELPKAYAWLNDEPGPRILREALALHGVKEVVGTGSNPLILGWAKECGLDDVYRSDATAWCGLFLAVIAKRAGWSVPDSPLWALNWGTFGTKSDQPMLGDVLTFSRQSGGHVGLYVGEDASHFHVLGGNQGDQVSIVRIARVRMKAARRSPWRVKQPDNVRPVTLNATGAPVSTNEE